MISTQPLDIVAYSLHGHTKFDLNDGCTTAETLIKWALEHGPIVFAITGHGNMMATYEFKQKLAEYGKDDPEVRRILDQCKLLYGVEAYVTPAKLQHDNADTQETDDAQDEIEQNDDNDMDDGKTAHCILIAKNYTGLKTLFAAVTDSYDNMQGNRSFVKPVMSQEMLMKYFGPGSEGHGNVVVLSACVQGILNWETLRNARIDKLADKCQRKADRLNLDYAKVMELTERLSNMEEQLATLTERRRKLSELKAKKFTTRLKAVEKLKGSAEYASAKAMLDAEIAETENAIQEFPKAKVEESEYSKQVTAVRAEVRKLDSKTERYQQIMDEAENIRSRKVSEDDLYENTVKAAEYYRDLFGADNFYIELQYHGFPDEAICFPMLANVAEELGIPCVATNDSHIPTKSDADRRTRQILRSLRFNRWEEEELGDAELYIKTDEELREALLQILPAYVVDAALANNKKVADQCNVVWPKEEHYPKFVGDGRPAPQILRELCNEGFKKMKFKSKEERAMYIQRCREEMDVIEKLNVVDYLLIVQDFLAYGRLLGKIDLNDPKFLADPFNIELIKKLGKGHVGYSIGPGRGSAVGSLVCYLIGITDVNPIKYNLLFARFLNTERVTMPKQYWAFNVNFITQRCAA